MAIDPSPTAEATRLIEPWRTSPATKIPGTFVSSTIPHGPALLEPYPQEDDNIAANKLWGAARPRSL